VYLRRGCKVPILSRPARLESGFVAQQVQFFFEFSTARAPPRWAAWPFSGVWPPLAATGSRGPCRGRGNRAVCGCAEPLLRPRPHARLRAGTSADALVLVAPLFRRTLTLRRRSCQGLPTGRSESGAVAPRERGGATGRGERASGTTERVPQAQNPFLAPPVLSKLPAAARAISRLCEHRQVCSTKGAEPRKLASCNEQERSGASSAHGGII